MRAQIAILVLIAVAATAQAGENAAIPMPDAVLTEPYLPGVEAPAPMATGTLPSVSGMLAPLPDVVVAIPMPEPALNLALERLPQPTAASAAFAGLPQTPRKDQPRSEPPLAMPAIPLPDNVSATDFAPAPKPEAPAATILSSAPLPAPAVPEISSAPLPPAAAPAPAVQQSEPLDLRLDRAFAAIGSLTPLPQQSLADLRAYYEAHDGQPVVAPHARPVLALVARAGDHGLDPRRFARLLPLTRSDDADTREIALAALAFGYARDARGGRINPAQVSRLITATPTLPSVADVLDRIAVSTNAAAALEAFQPQHQGYAALKTNLAELRGTADAAPRHLTFGPLLTLGMTDGRVPLLREVLGLPPSFDQTYDAEVVAAVRQRQKELGLRANGRLDKRTVQRWAELPKPKTRAR